MSSVETVVELTPLEQRIVDTTEAVMNFVLDSCDVMAPDALRIQIQTQVEDAIQEAYDNGYADAIDD